ncbi:MAG: LacI family DNA-binding transcriptional regulator, partial [Quadrisphaera sp.]
MSTPQPTGRTRPTALDVARRAGVSRTTVSFVLNGRTEVRGISPATADRVRSAAAELGYAPDRTARLLRAGTSDLVVLAVPGTAPLSALTLRVVAEVTDLLSMAGLHLVVRRTTPDRPFHRAWREVSPAAVIGLEVPAADLEELRLAGVPAVSFDVSAFDEAIGTAQARHLLERGHTSLAYAAPAET